MLWCVFVFQPIDFDLINEWEITMAMRSNQSNVKENVGFIKSHSTPNPSRQRGLREKNSGKGEVLCESS